jgi:hypothetical protein
MHRGLFHFRSSECLFQFQQTLVDLNCRKCVHKRNTQDTSIIQGVGYITISKLQSFCHEWNAKQKICIYFQQHHYSAVTQGSMNPISQDIWSRSLCLFNDTFSNSSCAASHDSISAWWIVQDETEICTAKQPKYHPRTRPDVLTAVTQDVPQCSYAKCCTYC